MRSYLRARDVLATFHPNFEVLCNLLLPLRYLMRDDLLADATDLREVFVSVSDCFKTAVLQGEFVDND